MLSATRYKVIDLTLLDIVNTLVPLTEPKIPVKEHSVRLKLDPLRISTDSARCSSVVTAHDLRQYRNHVYTIQLEENYTSWLDELLDIDRMEVSTWI